MLRKAKVDLAGLEIDHRLVRNQMPFKVSGHLMHVLRTYLLKIVEL